MLYYFSIILGLENTSPQYVDSEKRACMLGWLLRDRSMEHSMCGYAKQEDAV